MAGNLKNSHQVVERLTNSLPISLTQEDAEKYPDFCELLEALTFRMTYNATTRQLEDELNQSNDELHKEKFAFLQQQTLLNELTDYLIERDIEIQERGMSINDNELQSCKVVQESLTLAELKNYVDLGGKVSLLGLTKEHLSRMSPCRKSVQQYLSSAQQVLIPEIETRLRKKYETLVDYYTPVFQEGNENSFTKAIHLPTLIEQDQQHILEEKTKVRMITALRRRKFWQYYQELHKSLNILDDIIRQYRLKRQSENDTITSNWLIAKCDAMCHKLSVLANQLLKDTYTEETVPALKQIKRSLSNAQSKSENELAKLSESLRAYESIGMGFDKIVSQYAELTKGIEEKRWALSQLNEGTNQD